jgi:hypothetical protein
MIEHREFYRKKVTTPGFLIQPSGEVEFRVKDLSLDGFQGHFDSVPAVKEGSLVSIRLPTLELHRRATVVRITPDPQGGAQIGFFFHKTAETGEDCKPLPADTGDDDEELEF